ncbi:MAG: hypothetical protein JNK87_14385 [Bryobacterales bacterium]|nr:hypothetical protein [Bryobacterales bacterium]
MGGCRSCRSGGGFARPDDSTLIVGDAFCTTKQEAFLAVATQKPELYGPP